MVAGFCRFGEIWDYIRWYICIYPKANSLEQLESGKLFQVDLTFEAEGIADGFFMDGSLRGRFGDGYQSQNN